MLIDNLAVSYGEQWGSLRGTTHPVPISAAAAERRHAAGQSYAVLLSAQDQPLARAEYWPYQKEWRVFLFDNRSFCVQMLDLEPHAGTMMRIYRDTRWLLTGKEMSSDEWTAQTTIAISSDGQIEIETESDWEVSQERFDARMRGQALPKSDTITVGHFSLYGDGYPVTEPESDMRPRLVSFSTDMGHDHAPLVLGVRAPQFGDWKVFAGLLTVRGHEFAPTLTFSDDASEDHHQSLRSDGTERLFTPGAPHNTIDGPAVIELKDAGILRVPSGQLAAADPGWIDERLRTVAVPPGDYPVTLSLMRFPNDEAMRVGAARVTIKDVPVSAWEMALRPGEDLELLGKDQFYGVGVDTGMAAFLDATHGAVDEDTFNGALAEVFEDKVATELATPQSDGRNLIAFRAGLGDGTYPLWIGRDDDGRVSCVVLDFLLSRLNGDDEDEQ